MNLLIQVDDIAIPEILVDAKGMVRIQFQEGDDSAINLVLPLSIVRRLQQKLNGLFAPSGGGR